MDKSTEVRLCQPVEVAFSCTCGVRANINTMMEDKFQCSCGKLWKLQEQGSVFSVKWESPLYLPFNVLPQEYYGRGIRVKGGSTQLYIIRGKTNWPEAVLLNAKGVLIEESLVGLFRGYENLDGTPIGEKV